MKTSFILALYLFVLGFTHLPFAQAAPYEVKEISVLSIESAITPATLDYLKLQFKKIPQGALCLIKMNTPGGLVSTTKDIITLIGDQNFPVAIWITPEGASASSAGAIIAASAHFIFMTPGSNIGAATPVGLGEDIQEGDGRRKALNDLTALIRSLSDSRMRPAGPFEKMITEAQSFTDKEALKLQIIEGIASSENEIENHLSNKEFTLKGEVFNLSLSSPRVKIYEASVGQKILEVIADPSMAYFLFLIGAALIYFELQAPGGFIAGSVGFGFLILAAISFQVLPLDWGAFGLIILGFILLILEVYITSYGLLGLFGLIALVMGSLFLFHGETGFISVEYPVLLSILCGLAFSVGTIIWYLYREKKKQKTHPQFFVPIGEEGVVMNKLPGHYQVKVRGEVWNATSSEQFEIGDRVKILGIDADHLNLEIEKLHS
jgi:membrane-bound serine protease (ClpP class)